MIEISTKMYIRRKPTNDARLGKNTKSEDVYVDQFKYLGGSYGLRPFKVEEEVLFLPNLLGVSATSEKFEFTVKNYWNEFRVPIPYGLGRELEIGFAYADQTTASKAEQAVKVLQNDFNTKYSDDYRFKNRDKLLVDICRKRQEYGTPIKLDDYIIYRYALVSNKVANFKEDLGKSNRISFYIYSVEKETDDKYLKIVTKNKASSLFGQILSETDKQKDILTVMQKFSLGMSLKDRVVILDEIVNNEPEEFISLYEDENLKLKAFIEKAVTAGVVYRLPNTDILSFQSETIGNTINEAVNWLKNSSNTSKKEKISTAIDATYGFERDTHKDKEQSTEKTNK